MEPTPPTASVPLHFTCTPVGRARRMRVTHHLLPPWQAYQAGTIATQDLHLYEFLHEMHERRRYVPHITPRYGLEEARALLGPQVRMKEVERSLDRLQDVGLVEFSPERLRFPEPRLPPVCPALPPRCRVVDFPRRLLRYEGRCGSPGLFATTIGVLLRCTPHPEDGTVSGTIPAAWIANVMAMPERSVRRHFHTLQDLGWLCHVPRPHWYERTYGSWYAINLQWVAPLPATRATRPTQLPLPLPTAATPAPASSGDPVPPQVLPADVCEKVSVTPVVSCEKVSARNTLSSCKDVDFSLPNSSPLQELNHQIPNPVPRTRIPRRRRVSLFLTQAPRKTLVFRIKRSRKNANHSRPRRSAMWSLRILRDNGRLLDLHRQATKEGLIGRSPHDRREFVALAVHALRPDPEIKDPCALFFGNLRDGRFEVISNADEDAANARLKAYDYGIVPQVRAQPRPAGTEASGRVMEDALHVRARVLQMGGELGQEEVLAWIAQKERWTPARVRDVQDRLAVWATGGTAHAPPTRLLEVDECDEALVSGRAVVCPECGLEGAACVCPGDGEDDRWSYGTG